MSSTSRSKSSRSRRSCEPCRRKKVRCDGERPICSFCRRLKQECMYKNRRGELVRDTPAAESQVSLGRLQVLESKVNNLYGLLHTREEASAISSAYISEQAEADRSQTDESVILNDSARADRSPQTGGIQAINGNEIDRAVQIYINRIHGQPLLLFDTSSIAAQVEAWPKYLQGILYVSTSRWSECEKHPATHFERSTALQAARREIMAHAIDMIMDVRILQALCLLILEDIADSNVKIAWMSLAVGARIICLSRMLPALSKSPDWLRSNWSLHILDTLYCSSLGMVRALPKDLLPPLIHTVNHVSTPTPMDSSRTTQYQRPSQVSCINDCYSAILSVWSDSLDLLKIGENHRLPSPWADESPYRKIVSKLYDFETDLLQVHRVRHMRPDLRSPLNLQVTRTYWNTWFSVQILFHAVQAMINHPVLHIAGISRSQHRRPPSFLQHTVDELFQHAGWVKKLIDLGAEKEFRFNDPFLAHVTAIVATGWMFFINSDDPPLAKQAELGFETCYTFVSGFACDWPHLKHTIRKLDLLRESVSTRNSVRAPSVQASLLWELFDYSSSTTSTSIDETRTSSRLELGIATQYLSTSDSVQTPRVDELGRAQHSHAAEGLSDDFNFSDQATLPLENDFSLFDSTLFAGFQPSNFGDDFFADFGQL